jgi:cytidylate kinase
MTVIAIDGPAGAGKSTVARAVADRLGWRYVDTGAMYRAVALAALRRGLDPENEARLARLTHDVSIEFSDESILLDGEDVSSAIRSDDVTRTVSTVSAHPAVRAALVPLQRSFADTEDVVMEGRDIGNAVFPDAEVKVWLSASESERARRRLQQLGRAVTREAISEMSRAIRERDARDASRRASPMLRPPDAVEIDTTGKGIDDVIDAIAGLVPEGLWNG